MSEPKAKSIGNRARSGFLPFIAAVCLILLAILSIAQVAHLHPNQTDADHCQLCIVMHTVAPSATAVVAVIFVRLGASVFPAEPLLIIRQPQFRLFSRPPPVSL